MENHWDRRGRLLRGNHRRVTALGHDHVDLAADQVSGQRWQSVVADLGPAVFDRDVLALEVAGFAQSLAERSEHPLSAGVVRRCEGEDADHWHRLLLRAGQTGIRRRAGENRHEVAAPHVSPSGTHTGTMTRLGHFR